MMDMVSDDLAEACLKLARIREKKKTVTAEFNRQIKNIEKEIMDISKDLMGEPSDEPEPESEKAEVKEEVKDKAE